MGSLIFPGGFQLRPEPSPHAAWSVPCPSWHLPLAPVALARQMLVHLTWEAEPGAGARHSPRPGLGRGKRRPCQLLAHLPQWHSAKLWLILETQFQDWQRPEEGSKIPAGVFWIHIPTAVMFFPDVQACRPVFSIADGKAVSRSFQACLQTSCAQAKKATRPLQAQCHPPAGQGLPVPGLKECFYVL